MHRNRHRPHSSPPEQRWTPRRDVMFCWSQREDEEDWFMPMHPTGSKNFKNLAIEAQKVMKRCVSLALARALPSTGPVPTFTRVTLFDDLPGAAWLLRGLARPLPRPAPAPRPLSFPFAPAFPLPRAVPPS